MTISSSMSSYIKEANVRLGKLTTEIASGEKQELTSAEYTKKLTLDDSISTYTKINEKLLISKSENVVADQVMGEMKDVVTSFKSRMILANNSTTSDADRKILANELESYKDMLIDMGNTEFMGSYVFSGSSKDIKPFNETGEYEGSSKNFLLEISDGLTKEQGINGDELFDGGNIFTKIDKAIESIRNNEVGVGISDSLEEIDEVFEHLNITHSKLGTSNNVIEMSYEQNTFKVNNLNNTMNELVGVDITEASIRLQQLQLMFSSLFSTLQQVNQIEQRLSEAI